MNNPLLEISKLLGAKSVSQIVSVVGRQDGRITVQSAQGAKKIVIGDFPLGTILLIENDKVIGRMPKKEGIKIIIP